MRALFTFAIFLGSALLFLVQPMVAKMILPRFGGAPAVWTACLLFFQVSLLLGYLYAHLLAKLPRLLQFGLHLVLLALGALTLPFALPAATAASSANPTLSVLGVLATMIGLPFIIVSAGAPLLQRWFADTGDTNPYVLYAASNAGSMLGLLCYPFLVEPLLTLSVQRTVWTFGYLALAVSLVGLALAASSSPEKAKLGEDESAGGPLRIGSWILIAAIPASLLTGVTNYVTSNIAPIPLLWVAPLALYLLTFILAFARRPLLPSERLARWLPLVATPLVLVLVLESTLPLVMVLHLATFFLIAWMCHARLVETRPATKDLTTFYLCLSVGGVIGGGFNALVAPLLFKSLAEYPIAIVLAMLVRPNDREHGRADVFFPAIVAAVTVALVLLSRALGYGGTSAGTMIAIGVPCILAFLAGDRALRYGLSIGAVLLVSNFMGTASTGKLAFIDRSFFGVHRVTDDGESFSLVHGTTRHGREFKDAVSRDTPLTYYSQTGPMGELLQTLNKHRPPKDIALVGLGVGTLASYGKPGQRMTYYEIDPVVDRIAHDTRFFHYLRDSRAKVNVVLGDARLTLGQAPDAAYDLIVLDAFSSDAIPVHLLTREAVLGYLIKLRRHGLLVFHISNNYLDLAPVLADIAGSLGVVGELNEDDDASEPGKEASHWFLMAPTAEEAKGLIGWEPMRARPHARVWTDDYSNIVGAFKR